ncbi:MAG: eukaryotic-like serine/threonine-protein kinase [Blastocatellia bacterium]|jgi:serine/threonine protein kinase|nr:eukaryotic-like serine/threonine-protein kinase [Blastocatellia bacterium]
MEHPQWDRIQEIYYSTLPIVESERSTFVDSACGSDPFLVREVTSLLEADRSTGDFLEPPIFELGLRIITSKSAPTTEGSRASQADDLIGSTIDGHYLVERELGRGGIGAVYLARDLKLHSKPVVIKILLQASLQDPYVVKKFRQEVEALARIDHPGVVSILGAGELADGTPYIGMQYVNGVTLRSQIPTDGMSFERASSILRQAGAALDDVHEKRIFHRDLKPENIMLQALKGGTELVKIVDFGIAKVKDSVVAPSTVNEAPVGTVLYMSPEHLRGEKIAAVSDIYSMGVIAYEMVTGRRPFNPTSGPQLLEMHRSGVRVKPSDLRASLSTEAQAIILRALSFEPKDRYQSASEFGDALARALSDEGLTTNPAEHAKGLSITETDQHSKGGATPSTRQEALEPPLMPSAAAPINATNSDAGRSRFAPTWGRILGASLIAVVVIAALLGVYLFRRHQQGSASASRSPRSFTYWLTVQKMRDGRRYQDPFQSSGQEVFENGYKFRLNVSSPDPGYLYVLNEGPPETDGTTWTIVYPTPLRNNAFVFNQPVQTNWNTFRGQAGTENFWIVWSASPISQLEAAKTEAFNNRKGVLSDVNSIRAVSDFLTTHAEPKLDSTKNITAQQTHVSGFGDVVVKLTQLEHR